MAQPEGNGLRLWIALGQSNNIVSPCVCVCVCVCVWLVGTSLQVWSMEPNATVGTGSVAHGLLRRIVVWCVGVREGLPVVAWAASPFTRWRSSCQVTENVSRLPFGNKQDCGLFILCTSCSAGDFADKWRNDWNLTAEILPQKINQKNVISKNSTLSTPQLQSISKGESAQKRLRPVEV